MMKSLISTVNMYREPDNPFFGESVTEISLDDEAAGTFIRLRQHYGDREHTLSFDLDEIDMLCLTLKALRDSGQKLSE